MNADPCPRCGAGLTVTATVISDPKAGPLGRYGIGAPILDGRWDLSEVFVPDRRPAKYSIYCRKGCALRGRVTPDSSGMAGTAKVAQ